ncbi:tripartite tricarboxylate transporter substrate binding protein [Variovorax sp. J22R133]|uniref:tripartite tricarboxylate transporter substrate binding protein n=1 Tax=Variovorax brevis TaxID=3053503 RepID=UPI0025776CF9|nr:tripartite tricarboxylate transporter substrate binding protein [Variovorax sp. J22R133]MDM0114142.1 tripartite tricarboxylate transporter substrate binding protein [Variovorax sp. J22R133]
MPFAAGGPNDVMARVLAQRLTGETGQPFVVDNKAGAGGVIGTDAVAKAAPDGYTLGFVSAPFTMSPALQAKMPYDTQKDLAAVTKVAESPMLMMVPSDSRFKSAGELIDFAKKNPGKLNYGSGGNGSTPHLTTELLASVTGAKLTHVPYKGGGESIKALMGGEVDLLIDSITSTAAPLASGRVKALAISGATRSPRMPAIPTFDEAGIKNFSMTHWVGVVAPAKTPPSVLATLHAQIEKALRAPEVIQKYAELGATPALTSAEDFQKFVNDETKKWQQVVKSANIQTQ